jgi:hypothetical protein
MQGYEGEKGLKGRKGTNALYYYGMREATNHPFFCPVCLQTKVRLSCLSSFIVLRSVCQINS